MTASARSSVYLTCEQLERECRFERLRRSGPGGQNRNKVETAVRFHHLPSGLVGEASERRYQGENRKIALDRLRLELALNERNLPTLARLEDGTLALSVEDASRFLWFRRLVGDKMRVASNHFDYPIVVAEFFDVYAATDEDLAATARILGVASSQIVRLLGEVPRALELLNAFRAARGLGRLRA